VRAAGGLVSSLGPALAPNFPMHLEVFSPPWAFMSPRTHRRHFKSGIHLQGSVFCAGTAGNQNLTLLNTTWVIKQFGSKIRAPIVRHKSETPPAPSRQAPATLTPCTSQRPMKLTWVLHRVSTYAMYAGLLRKRNPTIKPRGSPESQMASQGDIHSVNGCKWRGSPSSGGTNHCPKATVNEHREQL